MADTLPPLSVKSFIWKRGAFADEKVTLHIGLTNHCTYTRKKLFHLFLDCDFPRIYFYNGISLLRRKFRELAKAKFVLVQSSKNHYFLASFVRLTWQRYLDILWYAAEIGLEHQGHAFYSTGKGYAVLRFGAKKGTVPRIVGYIGSKTICKGCFNEFVENIEQ